MSHSSDPKKVSIGGGSSSDPNTPIISHADFVALAVLPALEGACKRFGQEAVAAQIVELTLPIYEREVMYKTSSSDNAASFLSCTLRGGWEKGNISANVTNPKLAEKYGVKYVFGPIVDLGIVHQKTKVFCASKFFHHHSCRIGEVIDNFSQADYHAYIEVCKRLLEHDVYDWSIENDPEQWGMLRPSIRLYGMSEVLMPMAKAMIDIGHLPGTKDGKYKYSLMCPTIDGLYPILIPFVRTQGVAKIDEMLRPIVEFVLGLSSEGAFKNDMAYHNSAEGQFFQSIVVDHLDDVRKKGIKQVLKDIRPHWLKMLTKKCKHSHE